MTDSADLERRYRRLLAVYPKAFREEHEREMLAVLMAGADAGQRRPGVATAADLLGHGMWTRVRHINLLSRLERKHPGLWIWVRVLSGLWLIILTCILCNAGMWWGLSLVAPAALHFYLAARLGQIAQGRAEHGGPSGQPPSAAAG